MVAQSDFYIFPSYNDCSVHSKFLYMDFVKKRNRSMQVRSRQLKVQYELLHLQILLGCLENDEEQILKHCIYSLNILFSYTAMKKRFRLERDSLAG